MDSVRRPPPPPRSYTETVQDDVNDATSSSFLEPPPTPAAAAAPLVGQDYAHSDLPPPTGPTPRRRRSTLDLRVPQGWRGDVGQQDDARNDDRSRATGTGQPTDASIDPANASATDGWSPTPFLRMTSSTTLLVRDEADTSDDNDDDVSLGSETESFRFRPPSVASTSTSQRSSRRGVRVEDWSDRPNAAFVKDVKITGYHTLGSESSGFVVFDVELQTLPTSAHPQGTVMKIHRRYSAFVQLRHDLLAAHPQFRGLLPRLPPKSTLAKYRPSFLEKRRQLLGYWLSTVLLHPIVGGTAVVREWVLE
ncbi:hypothetical protein JCM8202v2_004225 [Rhodotorula sphaerocarpa]